MSVLTGGMRNESWIDDIGLKQSMWKYTKEGLKRSEMLSFLTRDFTQYAWSFRSLDRRKDIVLSNLTCQPCCYH